MIFCFASNIHNMLFRMEHDGTMGTGTGFQVDVEQHRNAVFNNLVNRQEVMICLSLY